MIFRSDVEVGSFIVICIAFYTVICIRWDELWKLSAIGFYYSILFVAYWAEKWDLERKQKAGGMT